MLDISYATLKRIHMSWVGNKARFEGVKHPSTTFKPDGVLEEMLLASMLKPYQKRVQHFYLAESDERENEAKKIASEMFETFPDEDGKRFSLLCNQMCNLLYESMEIPKANGGEFFVALFDDITFDGEAVRALGLWKVNSSRNYIKPAIGVNSYMEVVPAIDMNNVELNALIINIEESEGYRVLVVDTLTRTGERSMWKDDFLRLRPVEDDYYHTGRRMSATHEFVTEKMNKYQLTRPERFALMVKIGDYFHDYPEFEEGDFLSQIFPEDDDRGDDYLDFIQAYSKAYAVDMKVQFEIDDLARKTYAKLFRVNVKLDKNFGLAVKTSRTDLVKRGVDPESGKAFYTVYYDEEA